MSTPFKGTVTRASNGTLELEPDNQFDLQKLEVGTVVTVDAVPEEEGVDADGKSTGKKKAKKK